MKKKLRVLERCKEYLLWMVNAPLLCFQDHFWALPSVRQIKLTSNALQGSPSTCQKAWESTYFLCTDHKLLGLDSHGIKNHPGLYTLQRLGSYSA